MKNIMFNMIHKRTLLLTITIILCFQTILCEKFSFRQIDLNPSEIDPNVSPLNNRPNKPELINNNNDLLSVITTDTAQATTIPPTSLLDEIIIDSNVETNPSSSTTARPSPIIIPIAPNVDDQKPIDKFCKCSDTVCNCCRDFSLPLIPIRGPGCAKIQYLGDERMSVQIKYGDIVLASRTINGKKAAPVCVGLPGGYNRFCARFYGLSKEKSGFKSCMSLELRAEDDVEAQLRVSCFKFGKKGFSVTEAEPIPQIETEKDDEDDDDFFGLGGGDDDEDADEPDDDDDEDDEPVGASAGTDDDSADYDFRFIEEIFDTDDDNKNEKFTSVTQRATTSPLISYNEPQTKENSDNSMNNNNNDDININNNNTVDESVIVPQKNVKKNKKKKKHDEDDYDFADILYGFLNLF